MVESKIALVSPDNPGTFRSSQIKKENLALGYLASQLESLGHKVEIFDARLFGMTPESIAEEISYFNPAIIGVSIIVEDATTWTSRLTSLVKNNRPESHIVLGGYFPSLQPQKALKIHPEADTVIVGEGENSMSELVFRIANNQEWVNTPGSVSRTEKGEIIYGPNRPLIENLDKIKFPYRYGLNLVPEISIEGSRGCYGRCTFCAVGPHLRATRHLGWRGRSPESIVTEMVKLKKKVPQLNKFRFVDPDFIGSPGLGEERMFRLAELIKSNLPGIQFYIETRPTNVRNKELFTALKSAGLSEVYIGIESGSNKILKMMKKGVSMDQIMEALNLLKGLNINYQYGFMMFTPWSSEEDINDNVNLLKKIGSVQIDKLFCDMFVIPGTPAVGQLEAMGLKPIENMVNTGYLDHADPIIRHLRIIGKVLETDHFDFLVSLWSLFKKIRPQLRVGDPVANELENKISQLYINIFEDCLEMAKNGNVEDETSLNGFLSTIVTKYYLRVQMISEKLAGNIQE